MLNITSLLVISLTFWEVLGSTHSTVVVGIQASELQTLAPPSLDVWRHGTSATDQWNIALFLHRTATDSVQQNRLYHTNCTVPSYREKSFELSQDVVSALCFPEEVTYYNYLPRRAVERHISSYIFEYRHHLQ